MWKPPEGIRHSLPVAHAPTAEEAAASLLFSPLRLATGLELLERSWVPAMVPWRATEDGEVTQDNRDWYGRLADGEPGAIVVEATGIRDVPSGPLLRASHDRFVPGLRSLVDTVRSHSGGRTRLFLQLIDFLRIRRRPPRDRFLLEFLEVTEAHRANLAEHLEDDRFRVADEGDVRSALLALDDDRLESVLDRREWEALRVGMRERVTDVDQPHIRDLPRLLPGLFADAAARAREAGFDGVELARAGMDWLSLSTGGKFEDADVPRVGQAAYPYTGRSGYECMPTALSDHTGPFGRHVPKQARIRAAVRAAGFETPVVVAGGIASFDQAEAILARGDAATRCSSMCCVRRLRTTASRTGPMGW